MGYASNINSPWAVFAILGFMSLAFMEVAPLLPGRGPWCLHMIVLISFNGLTILQAWRRSRASAEERDGWRYFAVGVAVSLVGNTVWLLLSPSQAMTVAWRILLFGTTPLSGFFMALGVWKWPWRGREGRHLVGVLGSLVFCLSFLLLPWMRGLWNPVVEAQPPLRVLAVTFCSRLIITGGVVAFLIVEDARRLRGPMGWLLLNSVLVFFQAVVVFQGVGRLAPITRSPWFAVTPLVTGTLFMVAHTSHPVEAGPDISGRPSYLPSLLLHVPFLAAATLIVVTTMAGHPPAPAVLAVFLLMTCVLVLRQFILQEQVAASHRTMEARVVARTQDLERMQDVVLLNERLNAVVVLGAGLVHDLNKGLGSILSAAEVLQMEMERRMKVSGFAVEAIIQAVERSAVLSSRVMNFSKQLQEEGEVRDLRRELGALEGILKLLVPCGVNLLLQPGQEPAPVRIHTEDLKQILVNLVANARDALPEGGTIRVAVGKEVRTGETYLDVEDTGLGIPKEHLVKVFEPFFTTKDPGTSSGLGLASVKILLEKAQGRIEVSSSLGMGTRFRLLFPATASVQA